MNLLTIGSGSRLLFDFKRSDSVELVNSVYRSNLVSIMSDLSIDTILTNQQVTNQFLYQEFYKTAIKKIISTAKKVDYLIIDLSDEKFDLLKYKETYFTNNYNMQDSIKDPSLKREFRVIKNEFNDIWKKSCIEFISMLRKLIAPNRIILHEMYLAEKYWKDGELHEFENAEKIKEKNLILKNMYSFLKENFKGINQIRVNENYADFNHKYLLKPHLLSNDYYERLYSTLYNTFDLTQEYYKIPFQNELNLNIPGDIQFTFSPGGEAVVKTFNDREFKNIVHWSSNQPKQSILPNLKNEAEYKLFYESNLDTTINVKFLVEFYNKDNKVISSTESESNYCLFETPNNFDHYAIYLTLEGKGYIEFKSLNIIRNRKQGFVTPFDDVTTFVDSNSIKYVFEKGDSSGLLVVFSDFHLNPYNTKYDYYEEFKNVNINKLYILDDYGLNGTFYQDNRQNASLQNNIIKLITKFRDNLGISNTNTLTLGKGKGAISAIYYGLKLKVGSILLTDHDSAELLNMHNRNYHMLSVTKNVCENISNNDFPIELISETLPINLQHTQIDYLKKEINGKDKGLIELVLQILKESGASTTIDKVNKEVTDSSWFINKINTFNIRNRRKIKIGVLGGCGSRDIFRLAEEYDTKFKYSVEEYYARTGLISMVSKPILKYQLEDISLKSNFRRRSLYRDLTKHFINNLEQISKNVDYLVIDFMMERFAVLKYEDTFISNSWEFRESNLSKELDVEELDRYSSHVTDLWEKSCLIFINELKKYFKPEQIILNEVEMVDTYFKQNKLHSFDKTKHDLDRFNKLSYYYYQFFKMNFPGIHSIKPKQNSIYYGDSEHLWGCLPYHFNDLYYLELEEQIAKIVKS